MSDLESDLLDTITRIADGYDEHQKLKRLLNKSFAKMGLQSLYSFLELEEEKADTTEMTTSLADIRLKLPDRFFPSGILSSHNFNSILHELEPLFQKAKRSDVEFWLDHQQTLKDDFLINHLKERIAKYYTRKEKSAKYYGRKSAPIKINEGDEYNPDDIEYQDYNPVVNPEDIDDEDYNTELAQLKRDVDNQFRLDLVRMNDSIKDFYTNFKDIEDRFKTVGKLQRLVSKDDVSKLGRILKAMQITERASVKKSQHAPKSNAIKKQASTKVPSQKKDSKPSKGESKNDFRIFNEVYKKLNPKAN